MTKGLHGTALHTCHWQWLLATITFKTISLNLWSLSASGMKPEKWWLEVAHTRLEQCPKPFAIPFCRFDRVTPLNQSFKTLLKIFHGCSASPPNMFCSKVRTTKWERRWSEFCQGDKSWYIQREPENHRTAWAKKPWCSRCFGQNWSSQQASPRPKNSSWLELLAGY